jgi:hypothetical protein
MGKVATSHSAAEVAGPGVGGLLVQLTTAPFALVLDVLSYLISVVSLMRIRHHEPDPAPGEGIRRHLGQELAEGLRFAFGEPHIRATAFAASMGNFFSFITETIFLVYAVRVLHLSPGLIGLVLTAVGGLSAILLPLAAGPSVVIVAMCMTSFFVVQAALANTNVLAASLRQTLTPDDIRGRMNASVRTLVFGSLSLGGLAAGVSGSVIGLHATLWVAAIGYAATVIPILASPLPRLHSLPQSPAAHG